MKRGKSYEWIPLWIDKWLMGSTRFELEPGERSVFIDLMVLGAKDDGYIRANASMGYPHEYLARTLNVTVELLDSSIAKCIQFGKLKKLKNGVYYVKSWEAYRLSVRHKRRIMSENADIASDKADAFSVSVLSKSSSLSFNKNLKVFGNTKDMEDAKIIVDSWNAKNIRNLKDGESKVREKTEAKIGAVLKEYPLEVIVKAIENYSTVIHHPELYYFTYKWELVEFLQRGLRKFMDEAQPFENFKVKKGRQAGSESLADFDRRRQERDRLNRERYGATD